MRCGDNGRFIGYKIPLQDVKGYTKSEEGREKVISGVTGMIWMVEALSLRVDIHGKNVGQGYEKDEYVLRRASELIQRVFVSWQ